MGNVQAKNEVDSAIAASVSILNSSIQTCETSLSQNESIIVKDCPNIDIENVNFNESGTVNVSCAQTNSVTQNVKNQVDAQMTQMAEAIKQALSFNPGSAEANNIDRLSVQLSTSVVNTFSQSCIPSVSNNETISASCTGADGTATIKFVNFNEYDSATSTCVQNNNSVQTIANSIKAIIDQSATAKEAPLFSLGLVIIIIVAIFLFVFLVGADAKGIIIILVFVLVIVVVGYFVLAAILKWEPF